MSEPAPEQQEEQSLHHDCFELVLEHVRRDRYPSTAMLDLLEENMVGDERAELIEVLQEKVAADRYPSIPMLYRLSRICGRR